MVSLRGLEKALSKVGRVSGKQGATRDGLEAKRFS